MKAIDGTTEEETVDASPPDGNQFVDYVLPFLQFRHDGCCDRFIATDVARLEVVGL